MKPSFLLFAVVLGLVASASAQAPPTAPDGGPWWVGFGHEGLDAAIVQGLARHPDPRGALAAVRAAEARRQSIRAGRRPAAGAEAGYRWGREKSIDTGGREDDIDPVFVAGRVSWELDLFGRVAAALDSAEAAIGLSEADGAGIRLALALEIAGAYIDVAYREEEVALGRQRVSDSRARHDQAVRRVAAGVEAETGGEMASAALDQSERLLLELEIARDQAHARLRSLLGDVPPSVAPGSLADFRLPELPDLSREDAVVQRPDVLRAYYARMAAGGEATAARRQRLPTVRVVVSGAGEGDGGSDVESWSAWAGPVVSFPVWEPALGGASRAAAASADRAEAEWAAVTLEAVREIDSAWAGRTRSAEMIARMRARADSLRAVMDSTRRRRDAGLVRDDAWHVARIEYTEAARDHALWRRNGLRAHLALVAALGGPVAVE